MKTSVLVLIFLLILNACNIKEKDTISPASDYLPLEIGNYWQFEDSVINEIIGVDLVPNKIYFKIASTADTALYRYENQKIYVSEFGSSEDLKFKLDANVNDMWNYHDYLVTLESKTDTVKLGNTIFGSCYRFYFDVPGVSDEEYKIWLAPRIGFIKKSCSYCRYPVRKLMKAKIHNIEFEF